MASRRRGKGRRKVGARAPDAQPDQTSQEMTQTDRPLLVKPAQENPIRFAQFSALLAQARAISVT